MKLMQIIKEEIVPLSSRQNLLLFIVIACIFQFALFYTPVLADAAVKEAHAQANESSEAGKAVDNALVVTLNTMTKDGQMDSEAARVTPSAPLVVSATSTSAATSTPQIATSTPIASSTPKATSTPKAVKTSTHVITAYNSEAAQTDDSPCITANGFNVCEHGQEDTIAANFLKFGTKVQIPELFGDRVFVVRDRMNKKHPDRVDVWMLNRSDALKFGKKTAKIVVLE